MIVDTSALIAILKREPEAADIAAALAGASRLSISAGTAIEFGAVCARLPKPIPREVYEHLLRHAGIEIIPVDFDQVSIAWDAYARFGKRRHPANLNFGDCFAYALAKQTGRPLLFKGNDFSLTDVVPALPPVP